MRVRLPRLARGHARRFVRCKRCRRVYFYDYVPFSLSSGILLACRGISARDYNLKDITESQFRTARSRELSKERLR